MSGSNLSVEFRNVVESVFESWTALQLAIANESGGRKTQDKVTNMVNDITHLICECDSIDSYEVADTLHEMMDENFQTLCEDNSPEEIGEVLCSYFLKYKAGEKHLVDSELGNIKKISSASQRMPVKSIEMEMSTDEGNDASACTTNALSPSDDAPMESDSEWTVVKSKRRI